MQVELGASVRCAGEVVGEVADVVLDPASRRLTHVVVESRDKLARLVPADLLRAGDDGERDVALTCTIEQFDALESIRDLAFLRFDDAPAADSSSDVGVEDVVAMPQYEAVAIGGLDSNVALTYDRIPKGAVELRRSSSVNSADGHRLGHAEAFVVADGKVTHILLQRGHLWGARDVTIPIDAVESITTDCVTVSLSKDEVGALPSVRVRRGLFG
jgi:sporulation protein YlmC with PRC-barrel domain